MKLYATVTSERASKGQGGNEYLDIFITVGTASVPHTLAQLTVRPLGHEGEGFGLYDETDTLLRSWIKGNKQKGEVVGKCPECGQRTANGYAVDAFNPCKYCK